MYQKGAPWRIAPDVHGEEGEGAVEHPTAPLGPLGVEGCWAGCPFAHVEEVRSLVAGGAATEFSEASPLAVDEQERARVVEDRQLHRQRVQRRTVERHIHAGPPPRRRGGIRFGSTAVAYLVQRSHG